MMGKKSKTVYVAVLGFQGIIDDVVVSVSQKTALKAIDEHLKDSGYTAKTWFKALKETNEFPNGDYDPTNLYFTDLQD